MVKTILLENGGYDFHNWGDWAMLIVAHRRLRRLFPEAAIHVLTRRPDILQLNFEDALPLTDDALFQFWSQRYALGRLEGLAPAIMSTTYERIYPVFDLLAMWKMSLTGQDAGRDFLELLKDTDLIVGSGGGYLTSSFPTKARYCCRLLEQARIRNIPYALFGQGIGPLNEELRSDLGSVLPGAQLVATRERYASVPLLRDMGVSDDKIMATGDDAIELVYGERPDHLGKHIGINLRVASYSETGKEVQKIVGSVLGDVNSKLGDLPPVPVPIAFGSVDSDVRSIKELLAEAGYSSDGGAALNSVHEVIRQVSQCRVVITGSYHAGVFALSQGIQVVALSKSAYYDNKFHGLADMFGTGCTVLRTDASDFKERLSEAIQEAYDRAPEERGVLLDAAQAQIDASRTAYERLVDTIT